MTETLAERIARLRGWEDYYWTASNGERHVIVPDTCPEPQFTKGIYFEPEAHWGQCGVLLDELAARIEEPVEAFWPLAWDLPTHRGTALRTAICAVWCAIKEVEA